MGREDEAYMMGSSNSSRGRRLPVIFMLLAIVVATAVGTISVALGGGGMAMAKKQAKAPPTSSDATIVVTAFQVGANHQTGEEYAKCPGNKRALGGGVVQSGEAPYLAVLASGPLDETNVTAQTESGDIAKQWYAAVRSQVTPEPRDLKVFAICQ